MSIELQNSFKAIERDLGVIQGDSFDAEISLSSDITGAIVRGQLRKTYSSDTFIVLDCSILSTGETSVIHVSLSSTLSETIKAGKYVYDIEIVLDSGKIYKIYRGNFVVTPEVTKTAGSFDAPIIIETSTTLTADADLSALRLVAADNENLKIVYADANTSTSYSVIGMTTASSLEGARVSILSLGHFYDANWTWDTNLNPTLYLSTEGYMTQTPPTSGISLVVGSVTGSTSVYINIQQPIILIEE